MNAYTEKTIRDGEWCYLVQASKGFWRTAAAKKIESQACVRMVTTLDEIFVRGRGRGNAEKIADLLRQHGMSATVTRGRGTFGVRGYYDDAGYDFVAADSADDLRDMLRRTQPE